MRPSWRKSPPHTSCFYRLPATRGEENRAGSTEAAHTRRQSGWCVLSASARIYEVGSHAYTHPLPCEPAGCCLAVWEQPGAPQVTAGTPCRHDAARCCPTGTAQHPAPPRISLRDPSSHLQGQAVQLAGRAWFKSTNTRT